MKHHKRTLLSDFLREIVYGGNDGIVTTFAVVAGFNGASLGEDTLEFSIVTVLLFGVSSLLADASSMGLGNFLSIRAEKDVFKGIKESELQQLQENPLEKQKEIIKTLQKEGFDKETAQSVSEMYIKNPEYALNFLMEHSQGLSNPEDTNPFYTGFATFLAFTGFGFLTLIPYFFTEDVDSAFFLSGFFAFFGLTLLGLLRWYVTRINLFRSVVEIVALGGVSAIVAFIVGTFFK